MTTYIKPIQVRWSDIDANRHLRHSAYYDYGAAARMMFLTEQGLTTQRMEELQVGPVLFREEALFKREIVFSDRISIDLACIKATPDYSRWSIRHNLMKEDGTIAAVITVDGAWIDLVKRKLAVPDETIVRTFEAMPRAEDFEHIIRR